VLHRGYATKVGTPQLGGNIRWGGDLREPHATYGTFKLRLFLPGRIGRGPAGVRSAAGAVLSGEAPLLLGRQRAVFEVPQNLIYTRRIVQPVAAVKLTGRRSHRLGLLSAVDQKCRVADGDGTIPFSTILRAHRSHGPRLRQWASCTRLGRGRDYTASRSWTAAWCSRHLRPQPAARGSRTRVGGVTTTAPLWLSQFTVQHRVWVCAACLPASRTTFATRAALSARGDRAYVRRSELHTYGKPGSSRSASRATSWWTHLAVSVTSSTGRHLQDKKLHFNGNATLRGAERRCGIFRGVVRLTDSALYAAYRLGPDTRPVQGTATIKRRRITSSQSGRRNEALQWQRVISSRPR